MAPAMNAPRMLSRPSLSASTTKVMSSSIAARTRISAVLSWSRTHHVAEPHRP